MPLWKAVFSWLCNRAELVQISGAECSRGRSHFRRHFPRPSWLLYQMLCCCSVAKVMSNSLRPHGPKHTRLPCLSLSSGNFQMKCLNSWSLCWWHYLTKLSNARLPHISQLDISLLLIILKAEAIYHFINVIISCSNLLS